MFKALQKPVGQRVLGAVIVLFIGFAIIFGYNRDIAFTNRHDYSLKARFGSVEGLNIGAPVTLAGIEVGEIHAIGVTDNYEVEVAMRMHSAISLSADSSAAIVGHGIFGEKYIRLGGGGMPNLLNNGDTILYTADAVDFSHLLSLLIQNAEQKAPQKSTGPN